MTYITAYHGTIEDALSTTAKDTSSMNPIIVMVVFAVVLLFVLRKIKG